MSTDLAFAERGFGKALNGVVGVAGIAIALHFLAPYAMAVAASSETLRFNLMMIAAGAGSAVTLVIAASFKGVFMRSLRLNLDRLDRAPPPKPLPGPPPLSPRVAVRPARKDLIAGAVRTFTRREAAKNSPRSPCPTAPQRANRARRAKTRRPPVRGKARRS